MIEVKNFYLKKIQLWVVLQSLMRLFPGNHNARSFILINRKHSVRAYNERKRGLRGCQAKSVFYSILCDIRQLLSFVKLNNNVLSEENSTVDCTRVFVFSVASKTNLYDRNPQLGRKFQRFRHILWTGR